jgi:hypothetical protein
MQALFVLPYVSLVTEKAAALEPLCSATGLVLESYCGAQGNTTEISRRPQLAVCTIEKAAGFVATLALDNRLSEVRRWGL